MPKKRYDTLGMMALMREGKEIECPLCHKGKMKALNPYVFRCDTCEKGIVCRIPLGRDTDTDKSKKEASA